MNDEQERPSQDQLGQADLDQHAARERQHRAAFRARGVVLDVAAAGIDEQAHHVARLGFRLAPACHDFLVDFIPQSRDGLYPVFPCLRLGRTVDRISRRA